MTSSKTEIAHFFERKLGHGLKDKKTLLVTLDSPFLDSPHVFPYLGILYLLAVAREAGMTVRYLHPDRMDPALDDDAEPCIYYTDQITINNMSAYADFDVIGISCMTPQGQQAYRLCRALKWKFPEKTVIIGGPHAKFYRDNCLDKGFDIIVAGDGERIFHAMITGDFELLADKMCLYSNGTLVLRDALSAKEMNRFPIPYREKAYLHRYQYFLEGEPATTLVNSRGCPMHCAFCEHCGTVPKWFSPEHFQAEIDDILAQSFRAVMIFDDLFALNPKRLVPYLQVLKDRHLGDKMIFRCFGHANILAKYPSLFELLADAGCVEIGIGAESASQRILDAMGKKTTVAQLHDCVQQAARKNIKIKAFFMIGLPGETKASFAQTYDFIRFYREKYPNHFDFDLSVFFPYRGTLIGDAIRMNEGESALYRGKRIDRTSFSLRLRSGFTWSMIDAGAMGAYKKKGGDSDLVVESYDWKRREVLLSAEQIQDLKERAMQYSGRYTGHFGKRSVTPVMEGNIGQAARIESGDGNPMMRQAAAKSA